MASTISSFEDGGESATGSKTTTTTARKKLESVNREPEQENRTVADDARRRRMTADEGRTETNELGVGCLVHVRLPTVGSGSPWPGEGKAVAMTVCAKEAAAGSGDGITWLGVWWLRRCRL
ncbi:hypothetical protein Drorol1_Dr00013022 [Drosera rotundifolia]